MNYKILFDTRWLLEALSGNKNGIYFVAFNILKIMLNRKCDIVLYTDNIEKLELYIEKEFKELNILEKRCVDSNFEDIDMFFSPIYAKPEVLKKYPFVTYFTILYDTVPLLYFYYYSMHFNNDIVDWYKELINSINENDYYFAISNHTKKDFTKYFCDIDENKIVVIPLGASDNFYNDIDIDKNNNIKIKYNIPLDKKYIFSLCSLEPRKNLIMGIKSFIKFIDKYKINDMIYVLGGSIWGGFIEKLKEEIPNFDKYKDIIIMPGYIADEDLASLYSNAKWFIYTSEYEGFGLPPLEAMKCGCPVITSTSSSLPEVVGDAGIKIQFDDENAHVEAYYLLYSNEELRKEYAINSLNRSKEFSWEKCTEIILNTMADIYNKKNNKPKINIITPVFNYNEKYLEKTINSVLDQTYDNIEYIIVINEDINISEYKNINIIKTNNIYKAINEYLSNSSSKYISILNQGDIYTSNNIVSSVISKLEESNYDYSYSNAFMIKNNNKDYLITDINMLPFKKIYLLETLFIKLDVLKELNYFNIDNNEILDNELLCKLFINHKSFIYINSDIVQVNENRIKPIDEDFSIFSNNSSIFFNLVCPSTKISKYDCWQLYNFQYLYKSDEYIYQLLEKIDNPKWRNIFVKKLLEFKSNSSIIQIKNNSVISKLFNKRISNDKRFKIYTIFGIKVSIKI